ncbi:hypothetical protein BOTBODRAFT_49535 [Botryobasidium botryosum FD-172 SS1]|uniref:Uncharacterized protein n=1 Tax=Botryobasidium botryosum (strain FD-172 SS1) TaxID=930990 RepID=A0A067LV56_BOTB1|nr:hypothetical protein BOTBODRAFT_49535 [Botryobasidium botryosum FD-172 SS1]
MARKRFNPFATEEGMSGPSMSTTNAHAFVKLKPGGTRSPSPLSLPSVLPPPSMGGLRPSKHSRCPSHAVHNNFEYKAYERHPAYHMGVAALIDQAQRLYEQTNADLIVLAALPESGNTVRYFSPGLLNDPNARVLCESFPGTFEDAIAPRREVFKSKQVLLYNAQCRGIAPGSPDLASAAALSSTAPAPELPPELAEYLDYIGADSDQWGEVEAIWADQNRWGLMVSALRCLEHSEIFTPQLEAAAELRWLYSRVLVFNAAAYVKKEAWRPAIFSVHFREKKTRAVQAGFAKENVCGGIATGL